MIEHGNSTFDYRSIREVAVNAGAGATAGQFDSLFSSSSFGSCGWLVADCWLIWGFFRGYRGDFRLSIRCDQN